MKNLLLLAIFILGFLSCNTIKRVAAGYKDKISTNDIIIRDQFEKKYPDVDVIFYTDSAMQLLDILTFFSQEDADKSFKLPLPIVYDYLNGAYLNTIPAPGACFGGFDDNFKKYECTWALG